MSKKKVLLRCVFINRDTNGEGVLKVGTTLIRVSTVVGILYHTAKQLKDKVKNMSGGNSEVAQALIRTYFMERFLERVSVSEYRKNLIILALG